MNELVNYEELEIWNLLRLAAREAGRSVTEEKQRDGEEKETPRVFFYVFYTTARNDVYGLLGLMDFLFIIIALNIFQTSYAVRTDYRPK